MSVYKRPGAKTYSYDFQLKGRRFSGDTERASKREAEAVERSRRVDAEKEVAAAVDIEAPRTWLVAASRYWDEVGQHHKNSETTLTCLDWLTTMLGKDKPLLEIDDNVVASLVARRRMDIRQVGRKENRTKRVSPATVNRTATEPLRKVMVRARRVWKVPVQEIDWSQHMLPEPKERVREASVGEEKAIMAPLDRGYEDAAELLFADGCRRMEVVGLKWPMVDFFGRQYTVIGKRGKSRTIPMSDATFDLFWRQRGNHPEAVFTFVAQKTRREFGHVRGQRYPITEHGLRTALRRSIAKSGVQNFRPHDTRHTAATRVLRASNLRVAQNLLGHEDIATTTKYAHALSEDVRAALNATRPTKSPTADQAADPNSMTDKKKSG